MKGCCCNSSNFDYILKLWNFQGFILNSIQDVTYRTPPNFSKFVKLTWKISKQQTKFRHEKFCMVLKKSLKKCSITCKTIEKFHATFEGICLHAFLLLLYHSIWHLYCKSTIYSNSNKVFCWFCKTQSACLALSFNFGAGYASIACNTSIIIRSINYI